MSQSTMLTIKGLTLLGKALAGSKLSFTRVVLGDGILQEGQSLQKLVALISPKMVLPIVGGGKTGVGTAVLEAELKNAGLAQGFFSREIGIFAVDPDEGEILYAVRNKGNEAEYIPAGGGLEVWDLIYEFTTVIDQVTDITINIVDGNGNYASKIVVRDHIDNPNDPHSNWLQKRAQTSEPSHFWGQFTGDGHLHPVSLDDAKKLILGGDGADISIMRGRIDQTEREMANIALRLEAEGIYPDYNTLLAEDFKIPDLVDQFSCDITSIVAGDDSIDVSTLRGIVPGAWYTISDGVVQERVQVKSVVKNGSTYRLIMVSVIQNTYLQGQTTMYRTTAQIQSSVGQAEGSGDRRTALWQPALVWSGTNANTSMTIPLVTTAANASAFTTVGDIAYTADGAVTLA